VPALKIRIPTRCIKCCNECNLDLKLEPFKRGQGSVRKKRSGNPNSQKEWVNIDVCFVANNLGNKVFFFFYPLKDGNSTPDSSLTKESQSVRMII